MRVEDSLNECLDLLAAGASLEECLARHPEQRSELEPLLRAALVLRRASATPLRAGFRAEGRARVVGAMAALRSRHAKSPGIGWGWRYAVAGTLIVFLLGGQVVRASAQSLPGDTLYPVKRTVEQVQLTLTLSPTAKIQLSSQLANQRIEELVAVAKKRNLKDAGASEWFQKQADSLVESQASRVQDVESLADKGISKKDRQALVAQVQEDFERQKANLWQIAERVPEPAQPALRQAIEKATEGYQKTLAAVATPQPQKEKDKVKGLLGAVRPQDSVVTILRDKDVPLSLTLSPDSQITKNGAPVSIEALTPGDLVTATYDRDTLRASHIEARSPSQARGERVEFTGTVESQQNGRWVISGRVVLVGPDTELDVRGPAIGAQARVVAEAQPDGSLLARKLVVRPTEEPKRPGKPRNVQFTGTIENITPTRWLVSGREIVIAQDTEIEIEGRLELGAKAKVVAEQRPDGSLLAKEITVSGQQDTGPKERDGKSKPSPSPRNDGAKNSKDGPPRKD